MSEKIWKSIGVSDRFKAYLDHIVELYVLREREKNPAKVKENIEFILWETFKTSSFIQELTKEKVI